MPWKGGDADVGNQAKMRAKEKENKYQAKCAKCNNSGVFPRGSDEMPEEMQRRTDALSHK